VLFETALAGTTYPAGIFFTPQANFVKINLKHALVASIREAYRHLLVSKKHWLGQIFTCRMPFLPPNQQFCQLLHLRSMLCKQKKTHSRIISTTNYKLRISLCTLNTTRRRSFSCRKGNKSKSYPTLDGRAPVQ